MLENDKKDDPLPRWFEEAIKRDVYKNITTLPEWLWALDWRLKFLTDIEEKRKKEKEKEGHEFWFYKKELSEEKGLLYNNILRKEENFIPITDANAGLLCPVFKSSCLDDFHRSSYTDYPSIRLGGIGIDFSHDRDTLIKGFMELIDKHREKLNQHYQGKNKYLYKADKGLIPYTNSTAFSWSERKVLQCIDFELDRKCSMQEKKWKQDKIANFIGISKDDYVGAMRLGRALLTPLGVARVRASEWRLIEK